MKSTIYLGADHAGFALKEKIKQALLKQGGTIRDLSPIFQDGDDYPKHAKRVSKEIVKDGNAKGLLFCGSGVGMVIAANRTKGARAFDARDGQEVKLARQDNDANIMALSGWRTSPSKAMKLINLFLETPFSKAARHQRRITQLG
jgi:ribose 5-phosphate isomerase B